MATWERVALRCEEAYKKLDKKFKEAVSLLNEVNNKFDKDYDMKDLDWRNLDKIREFLKQNK